MEGSSFKTPYISLKDDPGQVFKFGQHRPGRHIFIISAARLQKLNIRTERTTVIAERWGTKYTGPDRLDYVTRSHWLARFWIPAKCIVHEISFPDFEKPYLASGIVDSM